MTPGSLYECGVGARLRRFNGDSMTFPLLHARDRLVLTCLFGLPAVGICAQDSVPANIHSVNYSDETFRYWLEDPHDNKNRGDGESVSPYSASGIMCCYLLPRRWRSGVLVKIHATYSGRKTPDGELVEVADTQTVEIPPYVDDKAGEIWVMRAAGGALSIVSSDYQPDDEKWPGKIKGWPVPSVEYRRKRWGLYVREAEANVRVFERLLRDLRENPDSSAESEWKATEKSYFKKRSLTLVALRMKDSVNIS